VDHDFEALYKVGAQPAPDSVASCPGCAGSQWLSATASVRSSTVILMDLTL